METDVRFRVVSLDPAKPEKVLELFRSLVVTGLAPRHLPLETTAEHIVNMGARCAILQKNVQDPDFLAEHVAYYSRWSYEVPRFCSRVHFFNEPPQSDDVLQVVDQMVDREGSYLGFVTLRPIGTSPVGATILRTPLADGSSHFILSKDAFPVHLCGRKFSTVGTPFIQQDNAVGACAQASIWMALRTLRRREGQAAFSPAQITNAATRFLVAQRTLPNREGLHFEQIMEALRSAGYAPNPEFLRMRNASPDIDSAKQRLYPYVESGIPVLLGLFPSDRSEGHAVLLIGHGWTSTPARKIMICELLGSQLSRPVQVFDAASWVEPFFVHNDNTGPYMSLPEHDAKTYCLADATFGLPFMQPDVFIDGLQARETCLDLLTKTLADQDTSTEPYALPDLVVRTYLQDKADFREAVLSSTMPQELKAYYRTKWLPRRVWVMEVNALDGYENCPEKGASRLGEILLDPSSEPEDAHFLTIHLGGSLLPPDAGLGGVVIDRDAFNGRTRAFPVSDGAYLPLLRR